jgi:hypothetical protein
MRNDPPDFVEVDLTPLKVQPRVTILDEKGVPLVGKECIAFSTVEPYFGRPMGVPYAISNFKFFMFDNFISKPSDINGDCIFENLTIFGGYF